MKSEHKFLTAVLILIVIPIIGISIIGISSIGVSSTLVEEKNIPDRYHSNYKTNKECISCKYHSNNTYINHTGSQPEYVNKECISCKYHSNIIKNKKPKYYGGKTTITGRPVRGGENPGIIR